MDLPAVHLNFLAPASPTARVLGSETQKTSIYVFGFWALEHTQKKQLLVLSQGTIFKFKQRKLPFVFAYWYSRTDVIQMRIDKTYSNESALENMFSKEQYVFFFMEKVTAEASSRQKSL